MGLHYIGQEGFTSFAKFVADGNIDTPVVTIDVNDSTTTATTKSLMSIDYDKTGITASSQQLSATGLTVDMKDSATNNAASTVGFRGIDVILDATSTQGTISQTGYRAQLTDGDTSFSVGYYSNVENGGMDFKAQSSVNHADYFSIATTTNGATTLTTNDDDTAAANLVFSVDGYISHETAAGRTYFSVTGNADDYFLLDVGTNGDVTLSTNDAAGTNAHFEVAADGNITLDAAADIALESGADSTNSVSIDHRKFAVSSSTDGDANGDVVYFGGTTSMTTGAIYHYNSSGNWELANADASVLVQSKGLLGVALGAASDTNGVLLRGMVTLDHDPGAIGNILYLSDADGRCSATAPSSSGDIVRIIGYQVSHASNGNIWFNPDSTFVEVA